MSQFKNWYLYYYQNADKKETNQFIAKYCIQNEENKRECVCLYSECQSYDAFVLQIHLYCDVCIIDKCRDDWSSIK